MARTRRRSRRSRSGIRSRSPGRRTGATSLSISQLDAGSQQARPVRRGRQRIGRDDRDGRRMDFVRFRPPDGQRDPVSGTRGREVGPVRDGRGWVERPTARRADGPREQTTFLRRGDLLRRRQPDLLHAPYGTRRHWFVLPAVGDERRRQRAPPFIPNDGPHGTGKPVPSPDGSRSPSGEPQRRRAGVAVARADGTGPVIQTGPELPGTARWVWAPDSSKILMIPNDGSSPNAYLLDPDGGPWTTVPWESDLDLDWQRVAELIPPAT